MAAQGLKFLIQASHQDVMRPACAHRRFHWGGAETGVAADQADAQVCRQLIQTLPDKLPRVVHAGAVSAPQPVMHDHLLLGEHAHQRAVARLQAQSRIPNLHALLMPIFVEQGPRIHVQRVPVSARARPRTGDPMVQRIELCVDLLVESPEEPRQGGLTRHRFDPQHLRDGGVLGQPRHAREFVRPTQDTAQEPQSISVGA